MYASVDSIIISAYNSTDTTKEEGFTITIQPAEFIYFDSDDNAQLLVLDMDDEKTNYENTCGAANSKYPTKFAIGLMALGKREVVIRYFGGNKAQVGIHEFEPTYVYLIILLSLAIGLLFLFIIACVYTFVSRCIQASRERVEGGLDFEQKGENGVDEPLSIK